MTARRKRDAEWPLKIAPDWGFTAWLRRHLACLGLAGALMGFLMPAGAAPEFLVTNWRNEEGLPHSIVNSILQTRDGYLWIATYVGLVRFDGVRFVYFSSGEMPELGNGRVSRLFEDRGGTLWIGMESGRVLTWRDGVVQVRVTGDARSVALNPAIIALAEDGAGTVWLQTAEGRLGRITADGVEFVAASGGGTRRASLGLAVDGQGTLWVGTSDGLRVWRAGELVAPTGLESWRGQAVDAVASARDGGIWVFRQHRLYKAGPAGVQVEVEPPPELNGGAVEILDSRNYGLWLAALDGTLFYLLPGQPWRVIPVEAGLRGTSRTLCEDREGNVWRGSFGGGLSRLRPKPFALHELPVAELDRYAYSVCSDAKGGVWALLNSRTLARIEPGGSAPQLGPSLPQPRAIGAVLCDRANTLWVGTEGGYLYRLRDGVFACELQVDPKAEFINVLFEDSRSNLWVGYAQGAAVGVLSQGSPRQWRRLNGISVAEVRAIAETSDGAMWFGTHYGGACRWQDGRWTYYTTRDGLPSDYVRCMYADPDGTLWLGTLRGLCRWRNGKFTAITTEHGLWNGSLSHIDDDRCGNLWLSSFGGVFRVARQELNAFADGRQSAVQCVGYNRNDGLPGLECPGGFQPSGTRTPDGQLWFPTVGGLVSIHPGHLPSNSDPPPVWIEAVTVDGVSVPIRQAAPQMEIGPGRRRFEFRFSAPCLSAPEKVRFRHTLDGLDLDWSRPEDNRMAVYSYIPPGHYTFRVVACNHDGVWNRTGATLALVVHPYFWQTWWFKAGLGLGLAFVLVVSVRRVERWRAQLRLERLEQQHALERERARIAQDIHDDLGASLTQIAFLSERVERARERPVEVEHWIQRIAAAARRTIQSLDEIVWAVSPKHDTLESLANYLSQFTQEHLALAGVRCVLEVPTVLPAIQLSAEVRHNLLLAAREALQNAVAHAAATEVCVGLELTNQALEIRVVDNGRGLPAKVSEGNGLPNMRRRLEQIGGRLELSAPATGGTAVRLWLPRERLHVRGIGSGPANGSY